MGSRREERLNRRFIETETERERADHRDRERKRDSDKGRERGVGMGVGGGESGKKIGLMMLSRGSLRIRWTTTTERVKQIK